MLGSVSQAMTSQSEPDQWFDAKKNYIASLEAQFTTLTKSTSTLLKKRQGIRFLRIYKEELAQATHDFGISSSLLSSSEADHDKATSDSFNRLTDISEQISSLYEKLVSK